MALFPYPIHGFCDHIGEGDYIIHGFFVNMPALLPSLAIGISAIIPALIPSIYP
jgi:hypothetical protein